MIATPKRYGEGQQNSGNGGVDTGLQHEVPHYRAQGKVDGEPDHAETVATEQKGKDAEGRGKVGQREVGYIEYRDHDDGAQIVYDG